MGIGHFDVVTPQSLLTRRAAKLTVPGILNPTNAAPLIQGEWLEPDTGANVKKFIRTASVTVGPAVAYPVASPLGSTDGQAIGAAEIYKTGEWEADTTTYEPGLNYDKGTPLKVNLVTISGIARSVLTIADTDDDNVVAVVEREPTNSANFDPMRIKKREYKFKA